MKYTLKKRRLGREIARLLAQPDSLEAQLFRKELDRADSEASRRIRELGEASRRIRDRPLTALLGPEEEHRLPEPMPAPSPVWLDPAPAPSPLEKISKLLLESLTGWAQGPARPGDGAEHVILGVYEGGTEAAAANATAVDDSLIRSLVRVSLTTQMMPDTPTSGSGDEPSGELRVFRGSSQPQSAPDRAESGAPAGVPQIEKMLQGTPDQVEKVLTKLRALIAATKDQVERKVAILKIQRFTNEEIARQLEITQDTVEKKVKKIRKRLRAI